ncbi:unnamed protein product [Leuciscus chuanchicus]
MCSVLGFSQVRFHLNTFGRRVYLSLKRFGIFSNLQAPVPVKSMSRAADYDALFASRFSSADAHFQRYRERAPDPPPAVHDWRARGRRDRRAPERRERQFPERRDERESHGHRSHY